MYQDLLEMERKLDWTMMRKRVEVQDALGRIPSVRFFSVIYIHDFYFVRKCLLFQCYFFPPPFLRRRAH